MAKPSKILVLDDEPNILVSLSRALELEDYNVVTARNVAEAKQQLVAASPDLCLFDVKLPDGDGLSLLETMGDDAERPPVIVMSGHGTIDDAVRALQLGAVDYLEKPIGHDRLLLTVSHTLERVRLQVENAELKARVPVEDRSILGRSKVIETLRAQIERVATSEGRVLITGENGTGKELIAHAIHSASQRAEQPFVSLNCAAVPADLIESELFGHEKGAFTGAVTKKMGKFERADGGTLFLDEVGDMPANMQAKLLRVLQTGELERVGGSQTIRIDVRVLAATNKDLSDEIGAGRFREDLYYRLNVVPLVSPPLRDRREDIPILVERFLGEAATRNQRKTPRLTTAALALLAGHDYPGNVRELRNLVERIVILAPPGQTTLDDADIRDFVPSRRVDAPVGYEPGKRLSELVAEAERAIVVAALRAHGDVIADTARALGVERSNFHKKLKALGLK